MYRIILIVTVLLAISLIVYHTTLPSIVQDLTQNLSSTPHDYFWSVYNSDLPTPRDKINWYWNTIPLEIQNSIPIAQNLSIQWPPAMGERFRMTAFPYPDTGKSSFWLMQFINGMSSLLDNTNDQATFPGWQVSIYDPINPNTNIWSSFLDKQIPWDQLNGASIHQDINGKIPFKPVYMECIHSCYAPPSLNYPYCDDGGYWLYGASGSGIFWSSGGYNSSKLPIPGGGSLVATNKIQAMFKLMETNAGSSALKLLTKDTTMTPLKYITNALKDSGGGTSLTTAMKTVISAFNNHDQIPKIVAFRNMETSNARNGWLQWVIFGIFLTAGIIILFGACIYRLVKHRKPWGVTILLIASLMVAVVASLYIEWNVATEYMLRGFGYMTLDMGLHRAGMNLEEFILNAAGRDAQGKPWTDPVKQYNPVANSIAQIQNFDFDLDTFCYVNQLDSIIMHTQPNKSGSWAVEIMDIRNTPFKRDAKTLKDLVYPLGLCGQPIQPDDMSPPAMPPLRQGPIVSSDLYLGFQPDMTPNSLCNCSETAVARQYDNGNGTLKTCLFCNGSISQQLC